MVEEYGLKVGQEKSKTQFSHFKVPYIVEEELPDIKTDVQSQVVLGTLGFQVQSLNRFRTLVFKV